MRRAASFKPAQLDALGQALATALARKVRVQPAIDASLLGGLTVKIGGTLIDDSLRSKLARLAQALKTPLTA